MKFIKYSLIYLVISGLIIIPGIFSLFNWGLRPSIDFTGGALLEIKLNSSQEISSENLEKIIKEINDINLESIGKTGKENFLLKLKPLGEDKKAEIDKRLKEEFKGSEIVRFETVGPILGAELLRKTFLAVILAAGFIFLYIAYQFKDRKFAACATLATLHDSLVILGVFSLLGHFFQIEIDTLFVTAVLTSLSFSVHDTVVVYDRIRETQKKFPAVDFKQIADKALSETMSRSVNNSLTIIFMLLCLFLLGGETIKWFVLALLIGTISGTYSSPFVATPLLVWMKKK